MVGVKHIPFDNDTALAGGIFLYILDVVESINPF